MRAAVFTCLVLLSAPAVALEVTAVSSSGTVVLDGCIRLGGLSLAQSGDTTYAILPAYPKSRRGPLPADARLLSRALHERIVAALKSRATGPAAGTPKVAVREVALLEGSRHLADAALTLDGELELVYGLYRGAGEVLRAQPRAGFSVTDAVLEAALERAVLDAYRGRRKELQSLP